MSELKELETQISLLSKRMEEQMRITRNLTALCTTLIVGLMFFIFCQTMEHLPSIIVLRYMSNLDSIVKEWRQTERCLNAPTKESKETKTQIKAAPEPLKLN
ncbi:hypothetical protein BH11CYA1_BH11CYA1_40290 [soil metagenome]